MSNLNSIAFFFRPSAIARWIYLSFIFYFTCLYFQRIAKAEKNSLQNDELDPLVITAKGGFATSLRASPWAINRLEGTEVLHSARSLPESLSGLNSVMVQKTALGQSSPYIRGFTGYHNVLLVDGIRINHSAMRSGPNQYWSTVEMLGADRLEIVRGPNGIIHGSDAIGGVVNIISEEPRFTDSETSHNGQTIGRLSSAESSWTAGIKGNLSTPDWFAELSHVERSFGDLEGGRDIGTQKNTGYDSRGSQFRLSRKLNEDTRFIIGFQNVFMDDVPRTHKTINGLTWEGLTPGSEIWRQLDQERNLFYGKFSWEDAGGLADAGLLTLSLHKHEQERNRMKGSVSGLPTGGDFQYFGLEDLGFSFRFETDDPWGGRLAYGAEWQRESLHSGGYKFNSLQVKSADLAQGPLAADAHYDRFALYLSDNFQLGDWSIEPGIRFSSIQADLERYYLKNNDSSTLQPADKKNYKELIGSIRANKEITQGNFLFLGLSEGFRPPSLYDLTSTDETSAVERPNTSLDSENFIQAEIGYKGSTDSWKWEASYYYTWITDMIVRSPIESGKSDVLKANANGFIHGLEIQVGHDWSSSWSSQFRISLMDSEVEQLLDNNAAGSISIDGRNYDPIDRATPRLMPPQFHFVTRYAPPKSNWWGDISILAVGKADDLSLKDETDSSRIPPNGTPGYALVGISGGRQWGEGSSVFLAVENLGDVDYRVHGSGLNGGGRNFILSFSRSF